MEILAPAGDWEALVAAVSAGADAVYLGGKAFNARQSAANFDRPEMGKAADYLHLRGRRLYVTFNTLIAQDELVEALNYAAFLREIGADAVIMQDLGVLSLIRELLPDLPVHASTQMTVHDIGGVHFLENLGVNRVVLARELGLEDIRTIRQNCKAELEVFVHGALCISYSGACLFSSMIGGRSGNRGRCAQPCRLEYELLRDGSPVANAQGPHLLSPKDLCLLPNLSQLSEAGVSSLKIEGRMKGPEYVATVVRAYRNAADRIQANPTDDHVDPEAMEQLSAVFNRGFCPGYLSGDIDIQGMSPGRPSNRGQFIGRVAAYDAKSGQATLELQADLTAGDGLEFWVTRGGRQGQLAEDLHVGGKAVTEASAGERVNFPVTTIVYAGDRVFRTSSVKLQQELAEAETGKLPCSVLVRAVVGKPLEITYTDEDGHSGQAVAEDPLAKATKRPVTEEILREQLGRLGDTPFRLVDLSFRIKDGPMVPLSVLNSLRREAIADLERQRLAGVHRPKLADCPVKRRIKALELKDERRGRPRLTVFVGSIEAVQAAASAGAGRVYFGGEEWGAGLRWNKDSIAESVNICRQADIEAVAALPRITRPRDREWLETFCRLTEEAGVDGLLLSHPGQMEIVWRFTKRPLFANHSFNLFNTAAAERIRKAGFTGATLSTELTLGQARQIAETKVMREMEMELVVHGALELMVSQFCPISAWGAGESPDHCSGLCRQGEFSFRDRKGYLFPIHTDQFCRMHLLNSVDLVLAGELYRFAGKDLLLRLELRDRSAEEVGATVRLYQYALTADPENQEDWAERVRQISGRQMTRGHYFRGVE